MECARRGFAFAFVGLVLMTIGFCLVMAGWFTPPITVSVLPIRFGGSIAFFSGLVLLLGSCFVCAIRQRRCCRRCIADPSTPSGSSSAGEGPTGPPSRRTRPVKENRTPESRHFDPSAVDPLMGSPGTVDTLLPSLDTGNKEFLRGLNRQAAGKAQRCDEAATLSRGYDQTNTGKSSSTRHNILAEVTTQRTSSRDVIRPSFEPSQTKKSKQIYRSTVDPNEYLYISPEFGEEKHLSTFHLRQTREQGEGHARRSSSDEVGHDVDTDRPPVMSSCGGNRSEIKETAVRQTEKIKARSNAVKKSAEVGTERISRFENLTLMGETMPDELCTKVKSPHPAKRCRSCEDKHRISQETPALHWFTGLPPSNGSVVRDLARRTRSQIDESTQTHHTSHHLTQNLRASKPERMDQTSRTLQQTPRTGRTPARDEVVGGKESGMTPGGSSRLCAEPEANINQISPVKYRRVLCPVHDLPTKPV